MLRRHAYPLTLDQRMDFQRPIICDEVSLNVVQ
jgi:hypothetical protein